MCKNVSKFEFLDKIFASRFFFASNRLEICRFWRNFAIEIIDFFPF